MLLHRVKFFRRQLPRLLQNGIRYFDLSHIVKRRRLAEIFYVFRRQFFRIKSSFIQFISNHAHIHLRIFHMLSRAAVPALDQVCHADDNGILYQAYTPRILHQLFRLLFHHFFQLMPVLIELNGFPHPA